MKNIQLFMFSNVYIVVERIRNARERITFPVDSLGVHGLDLIQRYVGGLDNRLPFF